MSTFFVIQFVVMFLVSGLLYWWQRSTTRRTREAHEAWARHSRFSYRSGPIAAGELAPMKFFKGCGPIDRYEAHDISSGERGRALTVFDLRGIVKGDDADKWHTSALFQFHGLRLARLSFVKAPVVVPGSFVERLHRILATPSDREFAGSQALSFDGYPGWELHAADLSATRNLFPKSMVGHLARLGWRIEGEGPFLLANGPRIKAEQLDQFIQEAVELAERLRGLFNSTASAALRS